MAKSEYVPVNSEDYESPPSSEDGFAQHHIKYVKSRRSHWPWLIAAVLAVANGIQLGLWYGFMKGEDAASNHSHPSEYAITQDIPTQYRHLWWNTEYSSTNDTLREDAWDAILPSHGIIAVDRDWAKEHQWPESMWLPDDKSKGVYLLEAYHQMHCLKILHKTLKESLEGAEKFTYEPGPHLNHCLDYILQKTMCDADATPLYTYGRNQAGDGQLHKCRDWNSLRDWAGQNSACYRDTIEDIKLGDHFGYCDDGTDGLLQWAPQTAEHE